MEKIINIIAYYHGCQICGKEFYTGEDGYKHNGKYICLQCGKSLINKAITNIIKDNKPKKKNKKQRKNNL